MAEGIEFVKVPAWGELGWLRHGFSTRLGGRTTVYGGNDLNLGFTTADERERVIENRGLAVAELSPGAALATVRQVHGLRVVAVTPGDEPLEADGMVSGTPGLLLGIQVADCVPVLLADTRLRVVAALHAGWRGTVGGIAGARVAEMRREFGSRADDLIAAVGPSIGPCCYEVGGELIEQVGWDSGLLTRRDGAIYFDLWEANRRQLAAAGVSAIEVPGLCTACSQVDGRRRFFSHRAEAGITGRAMGLIGIA